MSSKEICILATVSAGSLVVGALFGYYLRRKEFSQSKPSELPQDVYKSFEEDLIQPIDKYIWDHSLSEEKELADLRLHTIKNVDWCIALTDPLEAQMFRLLLRIMNAKKCIEIGSYTGYNTLSMALTIPDDGMVYTLDITDKWLKEGIPFFANANMNHKIDIRIGNAVDTLDDLIKEGHEGTIDFIYVDANKPGYVTYFEKGMELLRRGGIIAFDNTLLSGRVLDYEHEDPVKRADAEGIDKVNKVLRDDNRIHISFLKISDGVTLCYKI